MLRLLIQLLWVILYCVVFWLANYSHETPLSGARLLKGLATELCGPSDRHLEALPLRHATRGLRRDAVKTTEIFVLSYHTMKPSNEQSLAFYSPPALSSLKD